MNEVSEDAVKELTGCRADGTIDAAEPFSAAKHPPRGLQRAPAELLPES
ncbi:MAG: hypothetical protein JRI68_02985 [Deltaproteobacteria bacterium]|nr:hypothetical protein [Deltaproteobacteria bacterium]